jgi:hypothetical protein
MPEDYQDSNDDGTGSPKRASFWSSLEKNQKIPLLALSVFAMAMIILWSVQLKNSLSEPFKYKGEATTDTSVTDDSQANEEEALKSKDTDGDSLSDWDELNLYKTSPYLEDSDSDGFKDKAEIDAGKDPNCPAGRNCGVQAGQSNIASSSAASGAGSQSELDALNKMFDSAAAKSENILPPDEKALLEGGADAASLRKVLLDSGMDKKVLDQISDADLIKTYKESVQGSEKKK